MNHLPSKILLFLLIACVSFSVHAQVTNLKLVETYAGSSSGTTNGNRLNARFNEPIDMVFDAYGNLYIAEEGGSVIRIMDSNGNVSNFVGSSGSTGLVDGTGSAAHFNQIRGITLDNEGNLIVADKDNHAIRKVTPAGVVTTIAGGTLGYKDGDVSVALFNKPTHVAVHSSGDIYVSDAINHTIRKIDTNGNVSTVTGTGTAGYADGDINTATISGPTGLAFDSSGNLIITTLLAVRRYDFKTSTLSTIVGGVSATPFTDGDENNAGFNAINGLFIDEGDVMYIVDRHGIRHVAEDGTVTTLAGNSIQGTSNGAPLNSRFFFPRGIVKNTDGDFLIADKASHKIRRVFTAEPPVISITTTEVSPSTSATFPISFTINESVSDFTSDDVTVSNGTLSNFSGSGKNYTATITPIADGPVTIDVAADKITDVAGNTNEATTQLSITSDQFKPAITIASTESNPSNANSFEISFTISETVADFTMDDVSVSNGTLSNFTGSGADYTATVTPITDGLVTIDVAADKVTDVVGNTNDAALQYSIISDHTKPTVTIATTENSLSNSSSFEVSFSFSEEIIGFTSNDVSVVNGSVSNLTGSVTSYTATITPATDGLVTIDLAADQVTDVAGNTNTAANQVSITSDQTKPTVTIASTETNPSNATSFEVTFTISEAVSDFTTDDVTVSNATLSNFTGSGTDYTATITPTTDGLVTVDIAADQTTDLAGNTNDAATQLSITSDQTAPSVTITTGESSPTNATSFAVTITFSEDVNDFEATDIAVSNGTASNFAGTGAIYTADITPTADGAVTVDIAADMAADAADNNNTAATQLSITSDQTAPTVTITTGESSPTNATSFAVTITFSEDVNDFEVTDIAVDNGTASNFAGTGAIYTADITPTADGAVTVDIAAGIATDAAGNSNTAATKLGITSDQTAPTVTITTGESSPTNATSFAVTITFSEDVIDFTADDITVGNGTASNFAGTGAIYTVDIIPTADGAVTVDIAADMAADAAGNNNTAATQLSITSDQTAPTVTITTGESSPTNATSFAVTITFSEDVNDFEATDIAVSNGTASNFAGTGAIYTADITPTADGAVTVDIAAGIATDAAGNSNTAATQLSITSDQTAPTVTITTGESSPTNATSFAVTITFSEDVIDFTADDITVGNGTASNFAGTGAIYTVDIIPTADGAVTVDIAAGIATDAAGNNNTAATQLSITSDQAAPTMTITTGESSPTNATSFAVTITFSEDVNDFEATDIAVDNGTASNFAGTGAIYTADITPTADGAVTVDIAADMAADAAGNNNIAATQLSITSDQTAPTVTLIAGSSQPVEGSFTISATFNESVTDFTEEDIDLTSGSIAAFNAVNTNTYTFKVISDQNTATLSIAESKVSDAAGNNNEASESLLLTFNNSPEDILLDTNTIAENSGTAASIGNFITEDADENDTHIYTLTSGDGDTDNASFKITGNELIAVVDFDFETQDSYSIRVNSEDSFGSSIDKIFTITVTNVGEAILRVSGDQMAPNTGIGLTSTIGISIHNDGDGSLMISSITYPEGFTGPTSNITIAPSESQNITVDFAPTDRKTYSGDMVITSNGGTANFTLTGIGELVTSTEDNLPAAKISVYPNPASTYIALDLSAYNGTPLAVTLYDMNGTQKTSIQDYRKPSMQIDVSRYPNGIYLVGISDGKFTFTKKIMIRR